LTCRETDKYLTSLIVPYKVRQYDHENQKNSFSHLEAEIFEPACQYRITKSLVIFMSPVIVRILKLRGP
jgi:hypothetical protein